MTSLQQVHSKVEVVGDKSAAVSRQASDRQATDFATGRKLLVTSSQQVYKKFTTSSHQVRSRVETNKRQAGDKFTTGYG
jgi:hypothetical protein